MNRPKLCRNCAFPENFHTSKLGEISVFYAVSVDTRISKMFQFSFASVSFIIFVKVFLANDFICTVAYFTGTFGL